MAVTLKDIAQSVNLSISAVSLVLNDRPCRIPEEKKKLIRETAAKMNYVPNHSAQKLVGVQGKLLGIIIPNVRNAHLTSIFHAVMVLSESRGWQCVVADCDESPQKDLSNIRMLMSLGVSAMVIIPSVAATPSDYQAYQELLSNFDGPVVFGRRVPGVEIYYPSVFVDVARCSYLLTDHLLRLGHRRIAVLAGKHLVNPDYLRGIRQAFTEHGVSEEGLRLFEFSYEPITVYNQAEDIVNKQFTAVICLSDDYAFIFYDAMRRQGKRIPEDISVVGMNNVYFARTLEPPLTTIDMNGDAYGYALANCFFDELTWRRREHEVTLDVELVVRGSTAPAKETPES